jgi:ABC-type lipoprotein export system ATPase subunit
MDVEQEKMTNNIFLQASDIFKSYKIEKKAINVLKGINLQVLKNEWIAILGASGSGKTTLLNVLGTLEVPDAGSFSCGGNDMLALSRREKAFFRSEKIGFVFQAYHMFPELTVIENVNLPNKLNSKIKIPRNRAEELLERVGLKDRIYHRPTELSGGEQQRAAIARALINAPDLILADEPTGNLDTETGKGILNIFKELHGSGLKITIVMITHDLNVADYAERKIYLKDGKIEEYQSREYNN